ncbi:glucokinase [Lysobacter sp. SG-8]|uniref:Glucokinase n=1 Tax=Marilutibacter penaei TaxID=2759900 RepID=A0A7W3YD19_9GAMM|nr:glucokinase [Lysobacter penaei]MBB1087299.1 glucokinase [Lysobacter penaei]
MSVERSTAGSRPVQPTSRTRGDADWVLVGDIGGTHARFALSDARAPRPALAHAAQLVNADHPSLEAAIAHYLGGVPERPTRASLAVACPAGEDTVRLTNRAWAFSRSGLRDALGLRELRVINDFGALAWAIPALAEDDRVHLSGPVADPLRAPVSVVGPGTGLGVGLLVGTAAGGWEVIETEGGHGAFAPLDAEEEALLRWFTGRHGRVSNERLLCGEGLACIDAALRGEPAGPDARLRAPGEVVRLAVAGTDTAARRALSRFCAVLGSVAGDIALVQGARCVTLAGGMLPRFLPFLRESAFGERFRAKGRFTGYMDAMSVQLVVHPWPGLVGAAMAMEAVSAAPD